MPRYHFELLDDDEKFNDHGEGVVLAGLHTALQEAVQATVDIARDEIPANGMSKDLTLIVRDEAGAVQYRVKLSFEIERVQADAPKL